MAERDVSGPLPPALVLTAGLGTRLHPLTTVRAKPAIPVAGRPLVRRVIDWLAGQGVTDVVLNLHHRPHTITEVVGYGDTAGVRVRYSWEPVLLGSAGGPRNALPLLGSRFFIVNGDTLTDVSLHRLVDRHRRGGGRVTLAVTPHPEPARYGGADIDDDGRVVGFRRAGHRSAWHFVGVQLAEADLFADLPIGEPAATIGGMYERLLVEDPGAIQACTDDASFRDVGTPADYLATTLGVATAEDLSTPCIGNDTVIHPTATVASSAVWDRVVIGADCVLDHCIVTDDVVLPDRVRLDHKICVAAHHLGAATPGIPASNAVVHPLAPTRRVDS